MDIRSNEATLNASCEQAFAKLSNLEALRDMLANVPIDQLPADKRQALEAVEVSADSITIPGSPMGSVVLRVVEKEAPFMIKLKGEGIPVDLTLSLRLTSLTETSCKALVEIHIDVPMMLAPMVKGPLQQLADQIGMMLPRIEFA